VERFEVTLDDPAEAPCAERMPYPELGRCEHEWTTLARLPDGTEVELEVRRVERYFELEDWDRAGCEGEGERWVEGGR
jgi:hypothetical protein